MPCIRSAVSGRDMRDCCSSKSELTCDILSGFNFVLFFFSLMLFLQLLFKREALRRELTLFALHVTVCLALLSRAIYFLNKYFYSASVGGSRKGYCAYVVLSYAPITFLAMGAFLFISYIWYMSECTTEALARPDGALYVKSLKYT